MAKSKLPSVAGKTIIATFSKFGFEEVRVCSSHHILRKPGHRFILSVPVHGDEPVAKGTLRSLIRAAGITIDEFVEKTD